MAKDRQSLNLIVSKEASPEVDRRPIDYTGLITNVFYKTHKMYQRLVVGKQIVHVLV